MPPKKHQVGRGRAKAGASESAAEAKPATTAAAAEAEYESEEEWSIASTRGKKSGQSSSAASALPPAAPTTPRSAMPSFAAASSPQGPPRPAWGATSSAAASPRPPQQQQQQFRQPAPYQQPQPVRQPAPYQQPARQAEAASVTPKEIERTSTLMGEVSLADRPPPPPAAAAAASSIPPARQEAAAVAAPSSTVGAVAAAAETTLYAGATFPAKPRERGSIGRPIKLKTNHFQIAMRKPIVVYQYDLDLRRLSDRTNEPTIIRNILKQMFPLLMKELPADYKNKIVYNFSKNMYSLKKLPCEESMSLEIKIENDTYALSIKKINQLEVNLNNTDDPVSIAVLDLIFTHNLNYTCININRSFFKEGADFYKLGFGLELWKGAYMSVRPSEIGLTWNLDSANSAFLIPQNVLDAAATFYNCPYDQIKQAMERDREGQEIGASFIRAFQGREVKIATGGFRKKIHSLGPDSFYQFDWNQGEKKVRVTIRDYMKQQYRIDLKYPQLPCIHTGKQTYVPMELCRTELKHQKKLTEKETADVIKFAAVKATERLAYIQNWINRSGIDRDPVLKEFDINVSLKVTEVDGRVLPAPDLAYKAPDAVQSVRIGENGQWDHRNLRFHTGKEVPRWIVVNFSYRIKQIDPINEFVNALVRIGRIHGMALSAPLDKQNCTNSSNPAAVERFIEDLIVKHKSLDLIVCVLPGTCKAYNAIKTVGDLKRGIATQAVEDRNVFRIQDQTISNILLKINSKLGGKNFVLSQAPALFANHLKQLFATPIMVFGGDVTHPTPGDTSVTESIAAVVGSFDKDACYYGARLYAQRSPRGQAYEMIHDLDKMFNSLLLEFQRVNKCFPHRLVFFRDGVSEGQFPLVLRHEMNKIRGACQALSPAYKPAITFIIVQKRHHTRLFPYNDQDKRGKSENVPPGTVVDTAIVTKKMYDYFLCSHAGIQGTSRPCRYFVLHDDNNLKMNQVQLLSHYLCHVYSRCPRSVSCPAPAYYAHLAAFRGRDYIRKTVESNERTVSSYEIELHPNIKNRMFFI